MNYKEWREKSRNNRYLGKMRLAIGYPVGVRRTLALAGGVIREYVKHGFNIWDYIDEVSTVKDNGYEFSFQKDGEEFRLYLPQYETDYIQHWIVNYADFFEYDELERLRGLIGYHKDILDIGANIGNHTVFWGKILKANSIHCFEPVGEFYKILKKNVELNHLSGVVTVHNVALGNEAGRACIKYFNPDELGATQIEESADGDMVLQRLDDLEFDNIDFIKIDVETFEYNLLLGAKQTLDKHSPLIFIEIFDELYEKVNRLLNDFGYRMFEEVSHTNYLFRKI